VLARENRKYFQAEKNPPQEAGAGEGLEFVGDCEDLKGNIRRPA